MKRPTTLAIVLVNELASILGISAKRDVEVIRRRVEHEGFSFLTITLPLLSDALESGLEAGRFTCPSNFARHGRLPRLLGGFFNRVFDRCGELLDEPCPEAIYAIRQISRFFKKLKIGCSPDRELAAIQNFIQTEGELKHATSTIGREDRFLDRISGILWTQVFPEFDYTSLICRHGPGVTADRLSPNGRHSIRQWPSRSELLFPSDLHAFPNYGYAAEASGGDSSREIEYLDVGDEPAVRVVFVPKTLKAPRVIAIEPSHMQYMQQAMLAHIVPIVESHGLTRNSIRFSDQSTNQRLAHRASIDRELATLDLSEASDRVHFALVQRIFAKSTILEYLEDCRSMHATLPNGRNIILSKFASMGSALCFPVEAMVFYTLLQSAMHTQDGREPTYKSIKRYSALIDVYGDDIIVPVRYADSVVDYLESYALKVNVGKSFRFSHFRESCGGDFFHGTDVKPVYGREVPYDDLRSWTPTTRMSWAATSDQFYLKGLWKTAQCIRDMVQETVRTPIPRSRSAGAGLRFHSLLFDTNCRYNNNLYRYEQKRIIYDPARKRDHIDGTAVPCLNLWGLTTLSDKCVVERSGLHGSVGARIDAENSHSRGRILRRMALYGSLPGVPPHDGILEFRSRVLAESDGDLVSRSPLDFSTSVKRGSFKSKCRWVAC